MAFCVQWFSKKVSNEAIAQLAEKVKGVLRPSVFVETTESVLAFNPPDDRGQTFYVSAQDSGYFNCNTYTQEYTVDVLRCLILMVELGMAAEVFANADPGYLKELEYVNSVCKLSTYEAQKAQFEMIYH
jgi:hypothetical protein